MCPFALQSLQVIFCYSHIIMDPGGFGSVVDSRGDYWLVSSGQSSVIYLTTSRAGLVSSCLCVIKSSGTVNHDRNTRPAWLRLLSPSRGRAGLVLTCPCERSSTRGCSLASLHSLCTLPALCCPGTTPDPHILFILVRISTGSLPNYH